MKKTFIVKPEQTAEKMGSGGLAVLATPALVAMVENLCFESLEGELPAGKTTVGGRIDLQHLAPSHVGAEIKISATIREQTAKKISFDFEAFDGQRQIGQGTHTRFVIDKARFMAF